MKYKVCPKCKEEKATSDFYKDITKSDDLSYCCKDCVQIRTKERQVKNKEERERLQKDRKICSHCKQEKDINSFYIDNSQADGFCDFCKSCARIKAQKQQKRSRENFLKEEKNLQKTKKICCKCNQEKELNNFCFDKTRADQLNPWCKECAAAFGKAFREKNSEKLSIKGKERRKRDIEKVLKREKVNRERNREKCLESGARWKRENREANNATSRVYARERKKVDVSYKLRSYLTSRLWEVLRHQKATKSSRTIILLGCSIEEFRTHLESQFTEGMTWDNYGEWHVDHKKPCAAFNLSKEEDQRICFHYTNMQPLWKEENIKKSSFYEGKKYIKGYEVIN